MSDAETSDGRCAAVLSSDWLERMFAAWAGNPPVEFDDMDKDPVSYWCWKAWQKATALEREACHQACRELAKRMKTMPERDAANSCAEAIYMRSNDEFSGRPKAGPLE